MLDFYLEYGVAMYALIRAVNWREDVQVVFYAGQIRIGASKDHHEDLESRVGTIGVEPVADDFLTAAARVSGFQGSI